MVKSKNYLIQYSSFSIFYVECCEPDNLNTVIAGWFSCLWFSSANWCYTRIYGWFLHGTKGFLLHIMFAVFMLCMLHSSLWFIFSASFKVRVLFCLWWPLLHKKKSESLIWRKLSHHFYCYPVLCHVSAVVFIPFW